MSEAPKEGPLLYTLRQLHDDTAGIMEAVNTQNRPAVITRHGRFIAFIQPLANTVNLEGKLLAEAIANGDIDTDRPVNRLYSTSEILSELVGLDDNPAT